MGGVAFSGTRNAPNADIEGVSAARQLAPDRTVSHDQKKLAVELGEALRLVPQILLAPMKIVLVAHGIGEIAGESDEKAHGVFGHGDGENAAGICDHDS